MIILDKNDTNKLVITNNSIYTIDDYNIDIEFISNQRQSVATISCTNSVNNNRFHEYTIGTSSMVELDETYCDYNIYSGTQSTLIESGKCKIIDKLNDTTDVVYTNTSDITIYKR